ncbi:MAG TPA: hypothetical protein VIY86_14245, partial [Pirellulaceae bacterium]
MLAVLQAYAGQVSVWDWCLEPFLDALGERSDSAELLTIFTSTGGYPLGEHGRIGQVDDSLFSEALHVPLMIRGLPLLEPGTRIVHSAQPSDLTPILTEWFSIPGVGAATAPAWLHPGPLNPAGDLAVAVSSGEIAIRVPRWFLRAKRPKEGEFPGSPAPDAVLYLKPDDRWDANPIADRCPDIVQAMWQQAREFLSAKHPDRRNPISLPPELYRGVTVG